MGDLNQIIYRSSWELKFMNFLDTTPNVVQWSSEPIEILYQHPIKGDARKYNPDFFYRYVDHETGTDISYLVEIKPLDQITRPEIKGERQTEKKLDEHNRKLYQYAVNMVKFEAAHRFCADRGWEFVVLTDSFFK